MCKTTLTSFEVLNLCCNLFFRQVATEYSAPEEKEENSAIQISWRLNFYKHLFFLI